MKKYTIYSIILGEIIFLWFFISGIIERGGLPTNYIYWIAFVVELGIGYISYKAYKQYLINKNYKNSNLFLVVLTIIGFCSPIILFYTVDALKPVGSTWIIYGLTVSSFLLYRIVKKQPLSRTDISDIPYNRLHVVSKAIHSVYMASVIVSVVVLALLTIFGEARDKEPAMLIAVVVLYIFSILILAIGFNLFNIVRRINKNIKSDMFTYFIYITRVSFFESVAIFGLILWLLGGAWFLWSPLLVIAGAAMAFTFPTARRWEQWKA